MDINRYELLESCGVTYMARIVGDDGTLVNQATFAGGGSITYKVFDTDAGNAETGSGTLTVADVVYNAAQDDAAWPYDDGYNVRYVLPASCFPTGSHLYRVELIYTPGTGERFADAFDLFALNLLSY